MTVEGDISGEDFDGSVETETPSGTLRVDVILIDGQSYTRFGGTDWQLAPGFQQTQPMNPFSNLSPSDLTYVGPVSRSGRDLHQLRTNTWIGGEVDIPQMPDAELESSDFDIFVSDDGTPVESELDFAIVGTAPEGDARFEYEVMYEFSNVGQPVTIEAPPID